MRKSAAIVRVSNYLTLTLTVALWALAATISDSLAAAHTNHGGSLPTLMFVMSLLTAVLSASELRRRRQQIFVRRRHQQQFSRVPFLAVPWRLWIAQAVCNWVALYCLLAAFATGGMSAAYALKVSEPLFTCVVMSATGVRVLAAVVPIQHLTPERRSRLWVWMSAWMLCTGAWMCLRSGSRGASGHLAPNRHGHVSWLVLLSNAAFAVRTAIQKEIIADADVSVTVTSLRLFVVSGMIGAAMFGPFAAWTASHPEVTPPWSPEQRSSWVRLGMASVLAGLSYAVYQMVNTHILQFIEPTTYAMAKEARVVMVFVAAQVWTDGRIHALAAEGVLLVLAGSALLGRISVAGPSPPLPVGVV